jgi:threonine/homoserine/homoserine lactone efflux protein
MNSRIKAKRGACGASIGGGPRDGRPSSYRPWLAVAYVGSIPVSLALFVAAAILLVVDSGDPSGLTLVLVGIGIGLVWVRVIMALIVRGAARRRGRDVHFVGTRAKES